MTFKLESLPYKHIQYTHIQTTDAFILINKWGIKLLKSGIMKATTLEVKSLKYCHDKH